MDCKDYDGLVLSGGAARGAAFLGALHRLREEGLLRQVNTVAGTSIGSLVAVLFAQGADMAQVLEKIADRPFSVDFDFSTLESSFGLDDGSGLLAFVRSLVGRQTFGELQRATGKEVVVCATSLQARKPVYFGPRTSPDMEVAVAVRLSCTLPFLFGFAVHEGQAYVDGGLVDNFPVRAATAAGCRRILGLRFRQPVPKSIPNTLTEYVVALMASMAWQTGLEDELCRTTIELAVEPDKALDFSMTTQTLQALFDLGYQTPEIPRVNE